MKINIKKGGKISQQTPQKYSPEPSFFEQEPQPIGLGGRLATAFTRGLEAPGQLADALLQLLGEPSLRGNTPAGETLSRDVGRYFGAEYPEQTEPQSVFEYPFQRFLEQAPTAALFGPYQVALTGLGSLGATIPHALGAPEIVSDIAQLGTEIGGGIAASKLAGKLPSLKGKQKIAYETARAAAPEIAKESTPVKNALKGIAKELETEVDESIIKQVTKMAEKVQNNIPKGEVKPKTLMDLRKKIYKFRNELAPEARHYADSLTKAANEEFATYSATHPKFYNSLKQADKLTAAKNLESYIGNWIENLKIPGLNKLWNQATKAPLGIAAGVTAIPVERFTRNFISNDAYRNHIFDIAKAASKGHEALAIKSLKDLAEFVNSTSNGKEYSFEEAQETKEKPLDIRIVKGKRLA